MQITLNGQPHPLPDASDIHSLLAALWLTPDKVAVELNRRLVRRESYNTRLKEADQVEIVTFVGGGV